MLQLLLMVSNGDGPLVGAVPQFFLQVLVGLAVTLWVGIGFRKPLSGKPLLGPAIAPC